MRAAEKKPLLSSTTASAQAAASDEKAKPPDPKVAVSELWRFASAGERWLVVLAAASAAAHGVLMPLFSVLFGTVIGAFTPENADDIRATMNWICVQFVILGGVAGVVSDLQMALFTWTAARQAHRIREQYFRAVMRQDMAWHDSNRSGEVATRLAGCVGAPGARARS